VASKDGKLKVNFVGIAGCILAFISIIFPWFTAYGYRGFTIITEYKYQLYLCQTVTSTGLFGSSGEVQTVQPYETTLLVLALLIVGSVLCLISSIYWKGKLMLVSGILTLSSIIIFVFFMSMNLEALARAYISGYTFSSYLDTGFWLALVGAILMFGSLAVRSKDKVTSPPLPPPTSVATIARALSLAR
jgi:hypothetical protein